MTSSEPDISAQRRRHATVEGCGAGGACDYCGLPLPQPLWGDGHRDSSDERPAYCCFGCRFAASVTGERGDEGAARWTLTRLGLAIFLTMNVMVFTLVLWSYDAYGIDTDQNLPASLAELLRSACLLLSLPVLLLLGKPLLESAWATTRQGVLSTDLLVLCGVAAAYVYSIVSVVRGAGATYFEVGCMVLVMITLGRWLEATGKLRASHALDDLQQLLPETVQVKRGGWRSIPLSEVAVGEVLMVRPGERIPADGVLIDGTTTVDEQFLTGESWPVTKSPGESLAGGSLNLDAPAQVRVSLKPGEGTLDRLIAAVQQAREAKGRYQRTADRVVAWFIPAVAVIALLTLGTHGLTAGWGQGLMAALAVVLVACPCALGLATPLAVWCAMGVAARNRAIFRSGEALERLAEVRALRIDKTGTLTTGQPRMRRFESDGSTDPNEVQLRAARLAETSNHVFCDAILKAVDPPQLFPAAVDSLTTPGLGVSGLFPESAVADHSSLQTTALGSERLMQRHKLVVPQRLRSLLDQEETAGHPVVLVGWEGRARGVFVFEESLRPEAISAIGECRNLSLDVAILTGDGEARGRQIAKQLSVRVYAGLLPEEKTRLVLAAREQFGSVAMLGDGINDAPALAAADVGVALGCGTDATRDSADLCLFDDDLLGLPRAVSLSKRTVRTIRQNLLWAFGYNSAGVAVAATGWLHPAVAAGLMLVSSVIVIFNSLRLNSLDGHPVSPDQTAGANLADVSGPNATAESDSEIGIELHATRRDDS